MKKLIIGIICTMLLIPCSFTVESRNDEWSGSILFMDSYENETTIRKATPQDLRKMVEDALFRGDYWGEKERWLEVGAIDPERKYKLVPELGDAEITDEVAHKGIKSVRIISYEVPSSYNETFVCIAHYVRNQSKIKEGTYEVGAWFYVPEGNYPLVVLGMEYHPSWIVQYFAYPAIDMKDGSVLVANARGWTKVGKVKAKHNEWFKLWILFDTKERNKFSFGYESSLEEETFEGDKWIGYFNPAYKNYSAFNFYAGTVNSIGRGKQEIYMDDFRVRIEQILLKEDGFEYEKTFDFPENWWDREAHPEYEWHLEKPGQNAETTAEISLSGERSAKLWTMPQPGKVVRSVLVAPDFTHWRSPLKRLVANFYLPEGEFEDDAGVWLDIDLYDLEKKRWCMGIIGISRTGEIYYGDGYTPHPAQSEYKHFNGNFSLDTNKWYRAELYVDFSKFGKDGMELVLYIDEDRLKWILPLTLWTDYMLYNFSFGAYYFGISNYLNYQAAAYFDDVELWAEYGVNVSVEIRKPLEGYLYFSDKEAFPTFSGNTLIIGSITVEADVRGEISKVGFYIDDNLKSIDYDEPYSWLWNEFAIGEHEIKVVAHDNDGNRAQDKIKVMIFNFGGEK